MYTFFGTPQYIYKTVVLLFMLTSILLSKISTNIFPKSWLNFYDLNITLLLHFPYSKN